MKGPASSEGWAWAAALAGGAILIPGVQAEAPAPRLTLSAPAEITVGERRVVELALDLPEGPAAPLLLTPAALGEAVEVVRGRLLRSDARQDGDPTRLRFELPIVARAPGTAVVRVHVATYQCARSCIAVSAEARATLRVVEPP